MFKHKPRITIVSLLGRPFAGKDSQADRYAASYPGVAKISPGDKFRDPGYLQSIFAPDEVNRIQQTMAEGRHVSDVIVERMMHGLIKQAAHEGNHTVFLAGYPRTIQQWRDLERWEKRENRHSPFKMRNMYVHLQIDEDKANARRRVRLRSDGRDDDRRDETIAQRHRMYRQYVGPLSLRIASRRGLGIWRRDYYAVDADQSKEGVARDLARVLHRFLPKSHLPEGQFAIKLR